MSDVDGSTKAATSVGRALHRVLNEPAFRLAANEVAAGVAGLPGADHGAVLLERLAHRRQPINRPNGNTHTRRA